MKTHFGVRYLAQAHPMWKPQHTNLLNNHLSHCHPVSDGFIPFFLSEMSLLVFFSFLNHLQLDFYCRMMENVDLFTRICFWYVFAAM